MDRIALDDLRNLNVNNPVSGQKLFLAALVSIVVYIFLNPFPHTTTIREVGFYLALLLVVVGLLQSGPWFHLRTPLTWSLSLFSLWSFVGLFCAVDVDGSVYDFTTHWLKYIAFFCILMTLSCNKKMIRLLAWSVVLSVTMSALHEMFIFFVKQQHAWGQRMAIPFHQLPPGPMGFMALAALIFTLVLIKQEKTIFLRSILVFCFLVRGYRCSSNAVSCGSNVFFFHYLVLEI
ncbi:hypothetical protein ACFL5J_02535 [Thermodesulfobacteriota bacterium]